LDVGLPTSSLAEVVVTPTCGLAGASPTAARAALTRSVEVSTALAELAQD
jgi:hypothetical protein